MENPVTHYSGNDLKKKKLNQFSMVRNLHTKYIQKNTNIYFMENMKNLENYF